MRRFVLITLLSIFPLIVGFTLEDMESYTYAKKQLNTQKYKEMQIIEDFYFKKWCERLEKEQGRRCTPLLDKVEFKKNFKTLHGKTIEEIWLQLTQKSMLSTKKENHDTFEHLQTLMEHIINN